MNANWHSAAIFLIPAVSFLLTIVIVPVVSRLATRWNCIAVPNQERWHRAPTPTCGGLAFVLPAVAVALFFSASMWPLLPFLSIAGGMFFIGIYDDVCRLIPTTK